MSKSIKKIIAFVLILQMITPYPVYAAAVGKFTSVVGNVIQTRAGKTLKPVVNSTIETKDIIVTGDKSSAAMVFSDDSTITIFQNSNMAVKDFSIREKTRKGIFSLTIGKLVANVSKFVGGKNTFEVHSPTAVCGVRGTGFEFIVAGVGTQMATTVTCTTGALSVSALSATGAVISTATIVAGQTVIITSAGITAATGAVVGTGTAVSTATGTGTVTTGAAGAGTAGAGAAGTAGAAAAGATAAGIGAGTIATGVAVSAAVIAGAVVVGGSNNNNTTPTHTTTTTHH